METGRIAMGKYILYNTDNREILDDIDTIKKDNKEWLFIVYKYDVDEAINDNGSLLITKYFEYVMIYNDMCVDIEGVDSLQHAVLLNKDYIMTFTTPDNITFSQSFSNIGNCQEEE